MENARYVALSLSALNDTRALYYVNNFWNRVVSIAKGQHQPGRGIKNVYFGAFLIVHEIIITGVMQDQAHDAPRPLGR